MVPPLPAGTQVVPCPSPPGLLSSDEFELKVNVFSFAVKAPQELVVEVNNPGGLDADHVVGDVTFGTTDPRDPNALAKALHSGTGSYGRSLKKLAGEERCAYLDMTTPWAEYIRSSGLYPHMFYRDVVHANEYGDPILAKILISFFSPTHKAESEHDQAQGELLGRSCQIAHYPGLHEVLFEGRPIVMTTTEFRVLHALARRPGWVFTRRQISECVHGSDYPVTDRSIDVQIVALRKKLGDTAACIETVRGVGYRLKD